MLHMNMRHLENYWKLGKQIGVRYVLVFDDIRGKLSSIVSWYVMNVTWAIAYSVHVSVAYSWRTWGWAWVTQCEHGPSSKPVQWAYCTGARREQHQPVQKDSGDTSFPQYETILSKPILGSTQSLSSVN